MLENFRNRGRPRGLMLIELVLGVAMLGMLSVFVSSHLGDSSSSEERGRTSLRSIVTANNVFEVMVATQTPVQALQKIFPGESLNDWTKVPGESIIDAGGSGSFEIRAKPDLTGNPASATIEIRHTAGGVVESVGISMVSGGAAITSSTAYLFRPFIKHVEAGTNHALAVLGGGNIRGWGTNAAHQVGAGTFTTNVGTPMNVIDGAGQALASAIKVAGGANHSLAITYDGKVWAWGGNSQGQCGVPTTVGSYGHAIEVRDSSGAEFRSGLSVTAGNQHSMALLRRNDNSTELWGWGRNTDGCLGNGSPISSYVPHLVASPSGQWLAAGMGHSLILASDSRAYCLGANDQGQLGDGTFISTSSPVLVLDDVSGLPLTNIRAIDGGASFSIALLWDGTVRTWGDNSIFQLGNTFAGVNSPKAIQVGFNVATLTDVVAVAAGYQHSLALKRNGTVWAWGANANGQLGDGTGVSNSTPVQVKRVSGADLTDIIAVAAGKAHSLALDRNGTVFAWGANGLGQLGVGTTIDLAQAEVATITGEVVSMIAAGGEHSIVVTAANRVYGWGNNAWHQVGNFVAVATTTPTRITNTGTPAMVDAGEDFTVILLTSGEYRTWGHFDLGQLGDNSTPGTPATNYRNPARVVLYSPAVRVNKGITLAAGGRHALAHVRPDQIVGWGFNGSAQLGPGVAIRQTAASIGWTEPVIATFSEVVSSVAGENFTLALRKDGTVWAWGTNAYGQLGNGTRIRSRRPVPVLDSSGSGPLKDITAISAGQAFAAARAKDGTIWIWGLNDYQQLGNPGVAGDALLPVQAVKDGSPISSVNGVVCGAQHCLALLEDETVLAWGRNTYGQLGRRTTVSPGLPDFVVNQNGTANTKLSNVTSISAGSTNSFALMGNYQAFAWGRNNAGQLGRGTVGGANALYPIRIINLP